MITATVVAVSILLGVAAWSLIIAVVFRRRPRQQPGRHRYNRVKGPWWRRTRHGKE